MAVNMASRGETGPFLETGPEIFRKLTAESKKTSKKQKGPLLVFKLHFSLSSVVRRFGRLEKKWDFEHVGE